MTAVESPKVAAPPDEAARHRILHELDDTLFVEAGAGSGKTTALVDRVLALVLTGRAELRSVAAITFTEKAGAELRDRLRRRLEEAVDAATDPTVAARGQDAVDQLDGAAIGTLHAFAQRVLAENPVEAGLPPKVDVLDEVSSDVDFDRRWVAFRDELLADPRLERTILLLLATGVKPDALRVLAVEFDRNWDLVEERVPETAPDPPPPSTALGPAFAAIDAAVGMLADCTDPSDLLAGQLHDIEAYARQLHLIDDELELVEALHGGGLLVPPKFTGSNGRQGSWRCDKGDVKVAIQAAGTALDAARRDISTACARRIAVEIRSFTLAAAGERRAAGRLVFHDLLVLSRALVRHPAHGAAVRERLGARYTHLLLDEFQDTDPIQVELAVRIAAADPASAQAGSAHWSEVPVAPGHLFVVGDPKQSIYRFRRADISLFLEARDRFGGTRGVVELAANFRTGAPVIEWVNHTFAALMAEREQAQLALPSQPHYLALLPTRPAPPVGPPVAVLGRQPTDAATGSAGELRAAEAEEVAAAVTQIVAEGWSVACADAHQPWRPAQLGDITILVPARTSLPYLEAALDAAGIAYRAESSSLVYASRAVRDLLMTLRAVDDPTNELAIVSALRSPAFACGDDDLFRFSVERGGRWNHQADQPQSVPADDPVRIGLAYLAELHRARHWHSPSELLDRIARDRRLFELGFAEGRPRDVWRRLRYVIDQARGWSEATGGPLRDYLHWVQRQTAEGARVAEAVLPETDDDAVRIMTIHASKGLEFPITILSGMSTLPQNRAASAEVAFPPQGGVGYKFGRHVKTPEFEDWQPIDEQMGFDERIRLLYVACTRAEDHLVVSLRRKARASAPVAGRRTNAELLVDGMGDLLADLPDLDASAGGAAIEPPVAPAPPPEFAAWRADLDAHLARASRPSTVAATALTDDGGPDTADLSAAQLPRGPAHPVPAEATPAAETPAGGSAPPDAPQLPFDEPGAPAEAGRAGTRAAAPALGGGVADADAGGEGTAAADDDPRAGLEKRPRDLDLPPWLKGRYGTAVGRAVHGVLQTIDLRSGEGLVAAVAAQCEAEAIRDRAEDVERLVREALASEVVQAAAAGHHWREVYACAPVDGSDRLLEGYVDLLYRDAAGLVVVDYKTAGTDDPAALARRVEGYRLQGASYAFSIGRTTGESVRRVAFLFLTPGGAVTIDLADLPAAVAEVEALVARGAEYVVP